ncbi:hypothetical protein LT493_11360 [Streptomyces tricolor]|nr:hypothetical protein [Streptomyces tricolor]
MPALYRAEAGAYRGRWRITVYGPDRNTVAGPVALGRAGTFTTAHPDDPGRRLIAISGEVPVLPRLEAEHALAEHWLRCRGCRPQDTATDHGWSQISAEWWTAPCQPVAEWAGLTSGSVRPLSGAFEWTIVH